MSATNESRLERDQVTRNLVHGNIPLAVRLPSFRKDKDVTRRLMLPPYMGWATCTLRQALC